MDQEQLKHSGSKICRALMLYIIVQSILFPILEAFFSALELRNVLVDNLTGIIVSIMSAIWFVKRYQKKWNLEITWKIKDDFKKQDLIKYVFIGIGISFFMNILTGILMDIFNNVYFFENPDFTAKYTYFDNIIIYIYVIFIGPITEELLFRGVILKKLRVYGAVYSTLIVSLLFALIHGSIPQGIVTFFLSLILCVVTFKSNSLFPAIMIHSLYNLIVQIIADCKSETWLIIITIIIFIIIIIGAIFLIKDLKKKKNKLHLNYRINHFFKNFWGILFLFIILVSII